MLKLFRTKTFIKDYRKANLADKHLERFILCISRLLNEQELPIEADDHFLKGEWESFKEFHLGGDLLVIYKIIDGYVKLIRIGTHNQLFKKM